MIIYHISDLHIRPSERYKEYTHVFGEFCNIVKNDAAEKCVVITGDLFHDKSRIDSPGIALFYFLMQQLEGIDVYIIRGNHDYKQWKKDDIDMISSLMSNKKGLEHVHYLNKTGRYHVSDKVSFTVLAIQDVLQSGNTTANEKNLDVRFPKAGGAAWEIALFHGSPLYEGMFKGYNIAMLGDIHKRNVWKEGKKLVCGFAGSMIKQNKGEPVKGHGYIRWDLTNEKKVSLKEIDILNPWVSDEDMDSDDHSLKCVSFENMFTNEIVCNESILLLPDVPIISSRIAERNQKILKKVSVYSELSGNIGKKKELRLLTLKWNWILCYGQGNTFDFTKLDNKVTNICSANATGKTSFIETICIALFGTGFPSRTTKQFSGSIININKPSGDKSNTSIVFVLNMKMYRINRSFALQNNTMLHTISRTTGVDIFVEEEGWISVRSGKSATDAWVTENIGSIMDILMTHILTQHCDFDFFAMSAVEQKSVLSHALDIDSYASYEECLNESRIAHNYILDVLKTVKESYSYQQTNIKYKKELEELCKKQKATPKWLPCGRIDSKDHYQKIIDSYVDTSACVPYTKSVSIKEVSAMSAKKACEQLKRFVTLSKQGLNIVDSVKGDFDMREFLKLCKQFEEVKEPVFDTLPFNSKCDCCNERKKSVVGYDKYISWKKMLNTYIAALSNHIRDMSVSADEYEDAVYILENYEDIILQKKIVEVGSKIREDVESSVDQYIETYEKNKEVVVENISKIKHFTNTVYTEKILPKFCEQLNYILECLSDYVMVMSYEVSENGLFSWFLNSIPIHKASGFQKFSINISARIALAQITKLKIDQLFIDEVFNTCDEHNLSNVPKFLKNLLGHFKSILLITHLHELKEYIPNQISITNRDGGQNIMV